MQLNLQSQIMEFVVVIRCQGRIVLGDEVGALQTEVEKLTHLKKRVVLQLAEVVFIDSWIGSLGSSVRYAAGRRRWSQALPVVSFCRTGSKGHELTRRDTNIRIGGRSD